LLLPVAVVGQCLVPETNVVTEHELVPLFDPARA
jgi:hypothetical protein